ncbi:A type inclusion protein [Bovine papular stomatitis virus]|uniref:A type inclusion protein n=1 Tax=Bovine papular stomatitis virus TaxID=129727 RepID=A0A0E3T8M1_9POXV|nr:A type inclusion protein [Bovine papular stomatitis virus]AKC03401.1 A type inclusion protein [Bovine papular stomatitis virus]
MEELVERFRTFVSSNWYQTLNNRTCIPVEIRKLVRDLLREYINHAPPLDDNNKNAGRPINLFYKPYVDKNPVYKELFKNNVWLYESAVAIKDFNDMGTVGRFLLMIVYRIMTGSISNGMTIMDGKDPNNVAVVDVQMDYFCYNFMWYMGSISTYYKNKSLVFGVPMYWWRGPSLEENVNKKINESFNTPDQQKYASGAISFVKYMTEIYDKADTNMPRINVSFNNFNTDFIATVPEFVMDGLCYTVWDKITKYGTTFYLDVFLTPNRYNGAMFKSIDHDKQGVLDGITKPDTIDCSALRFSYHPSFSRRVLHTPEGARARRQPRQMEDTFERQHDVNKGESTMFTRNSENNGYYLDYQHYSSVEPITNNEFERRDKLTYDRKSCRKLRFLGDLDNDKTTYRRMLRDRFIGYLEIKPDVPKKDDAIGDEEPVCMDINKLDSLIKPLEDAIRSIPKPCCSSKPSGVTSLASVNGSLSSVREVERPLSIARRSLLTRPFFRHHPYRFPLDSTWWRGRDGNIW